MPNLFAHFEVNREARWPILLRLVGVSLAFHMLGLATVVYVPPLRDALNVAALMSDSRFVDRPYARTELGENIQVVQLMPKFHYPEGYFALDADVTVQPPPFNTGDRIISQAKPPTPIASPTPSPEPSPSPSETPKSTAATPNTSISGTTGAAVGAQASPAPDAQKDSTADQKAQAQLEQAAAANNVDLPAENEINKKPLKDLASYANDLNHDGKLNLNQSFEVTVVADLDTTGKLQNPSFTQKSGDPGLIDLAGKMISALNDSNILVYLRRLNEGKPTRIIFVISQDKSELLAKVESEVSSEESARQKARGFNALLVLGQKAREGKDEEILMRNTAASAEGKKVVFNFSMPREAVVEMIKKQLALNGTTKQG
jgi:hypothetical protein